MKVLAVAAEQVEIAGWMHAAGGGAILQWPVTHSCQFRSGSAEVTAVANGAGRRLAGEAVAAAWRENGPFDRVVSIGYAGALDQGLGLLAVRCASVISDGERSIPATPLPGIESARLLSIDRFLGDPPEKARWRAAGHELVEMEAAAVAAEASRRGVPFHAVKVVTDLAVERMELDFNACRDAEGRFDRGRIVRSALRRPFTYLPSLWRFAVRAPQAARKLGETLAGIRF